MLLCWIKNFENVEYILLMSFYYAHLVFRHCNKFDLKVHVALSKLLRAVCTVETEKLISKQSKHVYQS